jgi:hypothetical protein
MRRHARIATAGLLAALGALAARPGAGGAPADDPGPLLAAVKAVGKEGAGNPEAAGAWKALARLGPDALPAVLAALPDGDPTAANWLRPAVDAIAERAARDGRPLPAAELERFVKDARHGNAARRIAYELLCRADKTAPDRLLPGMLQDRSPELRRDAVAAATESARKLLDGGDKEAATAAYRKALSGACDKDQVDAIAQRLKALGRPVDLAAHFGFLRTWHLLAPFDNHGGVGFKEAYPPEKGVDLAAVYKGKGGKEARWAAHTTDSPYGAVDLNKALGKQKGTVAYAFAAIDSPTERPVQVRVGSINAVKIFLNGKELFAREEYHHGVEMDQYVAAGTLKAGRNEVLLKVCQNEQSEEWAQAWGFQARLCDAAGAAVPFKPAQGGRHAE